MFFFRSDVPKSNEAKHLEYSKIRIVTTRNYAGFDDENPGEPRSYLFSAAWNQPIPVDELSPTLVMNFDREALEADDEQSDGDLIIGQYDEVEKWIGTRPYTPKRAFFAAMSLKRDSEDAKPAFDPNVPTDNIAHYRLFLVLKPTTTVTGSQSAE
jgi:hypothetical protein